MSSTATISLKRSRSSTPLLHTPPRAPSPATKGDPPGRRDLATKEPQIKQELERWENIVFSFSMENRGGESNSEEYPGSHQSHASGFTTTPWDMASFFPTPPYSQHLPYDVLGLGMMNPIPPSHPQLSPHIAPDPFGSPWDLGLHGEMQHPQTPPQPLTPAEIAQYHALLARGAAGFPPPSLNVSQHIPVAESSSRSSPSPPTSQAPTARSRSTSTSGRTPSQGQSSGMAIQDDESVAIAEDKRRRNTVASARFRVKKKQRTMELEKTVVELEGRADELEKEAVELRRENGWLKEMVILKGRKAMENTQAGSRSGTKTGQGSSGDQEMDKGNSNGGEGGDGNDKGKGKSKE